MKPIKDLEGYFITKDGEVWSNKRKALRQLAIRPCNSKGYSDIKLQGKMYKIHRLVAEAFIPNPDNKPQVNHKNGNKQMNFDWNLEWVTNSENQLHAYENGLNQRKPSANRALTQDEADFIRAEYIDKKTSQRVLAQHYGVSKTTIADILNGKHYNINRDIKPVTIVTRNKPKLTYDDAQIIRKRFNDEKISMRALGREFGVNHSVISCILKNKTYTSKV